MMYVPPCVSSCCPLGPADSHAQSHANLSPWRYVGICHWPPMIIAPFPTEKRSTALFEAGVGATLCFVTRSVHHWSVLTASAVVGRNLVRSSLTNFPPLCSRNASACQS